MDRIWLQVLAFNFVMLGLDVIVGLVVWRSRSILASLAAIAVLAASAAMVAAMIGQAVFETLYLLCFGWFFHVPLVALLFAASTWRRHRMWAYAGLAAVILTAGIAIDAFLIEPQWLEVTTMEVISDKVTRPWRVALVADLQTDHLGRHERRAFREIHAAQPDVVLMAGDYLQAGPETLPRLRDEFNTYLREIGFQAPCGIFAVGGNSDSHDWQRIFADVPVTHFLQTDQCTTGELTITGLSVPDSFDPSLEVPAQPRFQIALGHAPDFALGDVRADLLLAGHTHGGQVQLPFIGPLITFSQVPRSWASGRTQLDDHRTLIVSRGIGMERLAAPRLRFLCRPQLVIIDIRPPSDGAASTDNPGS